MKTWHWVVLSLFLLAGCSADQGSGPAPEETAAERPIVYASNYPLQYFAERISTPLVDVRLLVPDDVDPAWWKPTAEEVLVLQQSDLVLLNGASYESWLDNVSLPASRTVDTSAGFSEHFVIEKEATTHSHGPGGEHEHTATAFTTWLDPTLAVDQARAIKDAFSGLWPKHAGQFETQFAALAAELEILDANIRTITEAAPDRPVIFSHPVYQYLARRYGLNGRSFHWEPNEMPSDHEWHHLTEALDSHPAEWMIWEGEPSPEINARLAELGVGSVVFDPCGGAPEKGDFATVMNSNITALETVYALPE